jgi:hypothetical protein
MTNLDGLAVLLFVINSVTGNGLGTQLLQVKRVRSSTPNRHPSHRAARCGCNLDI